MCSLRLCYFQNQLFQNRTAKHYHKIYKKEEPFMFEARLVKCSYFYQFALLLGVVWQSVASRCWAHHRGRDGNSIPVPFQMWSGILSVHQLQSVVLSVQTLQSVLLSVQTWQSVVLSVQYSQSVLLLSSSCSLCYCLSSSCSLCYCLSSSCRLCYCLSITRNLWCCLSNSCIPKNMYVCVIFLAAQEISLIEKQ